MARLAKGFFRWWTGERRTSESVHNIGQIFNDNSEEKEFFDLVFTSFKNYDESNNVHKNDNFSADIEFIIKGASASLTSSKRSQRFPKRIDAYLYIYRRIVEYIQMAKESNDQIKEFRKQLYEKLASTFASTKGLEPNLCIKDNNLLRRINIPEHLTFIEEISDNITLNIFFVLCKLSFQSSSFVNDHNYVKWFAIVSEIKRWKICITDFISSYKTYIQAFEHFPLGIPEFIYLASNIHPSNNCQASPFAAYIGLLNILNLNQKTFFQQFQNAFDNGMKKQLYKHPHIVSLFRVLSIEDEHLFAAYVRIFSLNVSDDQLWEMFLYLSKTIGLNENMSKYFSIILTERTQNILVKDFKRYCSLAKTCLEQTKNENRLNFLKVLEIVFHSFFNKQLNDDQYPYRFTPFDLKEFLNITLELSSTHSLQQPTCLVIIRHILFKLDKSKYYKSREIRYLFERLNNFDKSLCEKNDPAGIVRDEWLTDYIYHGSLQWKLINREDYQSLCDSHFNNRWAIYIWSRIVHLSFIRLETTKLNEVLGQLNEWMNTVKHDIYVRNDILTTIFVKGIFEIIIIKYIKSVLSLQNIGSILRYILRAKDDQPGLIDATQVNDFIQNVQYSLKAVFLLNGTRTIYRDLLDTSIVYDFLPSCDVKNILSTTDPQLYKFPITARVIDSIVSIQKPIDIDITVIESKDQFFRHFIEQVNKWLQWFDEFIEIFQHIIKWLKECKVEGAVQLFNEVYTIKNDATVPVIAIKTIINQILKFLKPFNNLERLCDLFFNSFGVINSGTLSDPNQWKLYTTESKRLHPHNKFIVAALSLYMLPVPIDDCRHVYWSLACENLTCNVKIEYRMNGSHNQNYQLFDKQNVPLQKQILQGEFKTQRNGCLIISIDNRKGLAPRSVWYRARTTVISTYHLFNGILKMHKQKYVAETEQTAKDSDMVEWIDQTFLFIDKLLDGNITLQDMDYLKIVFHDKNINVREEVKKLFTNRTVVNSNIVPARSTTSNTSADREIEQVCEWLRTYQYYSHLSIIIDCVQKFNIVSNSDVNDKSIDHLQEIIVNENCSLKEISKIYEDLYRRFQKLTNHHLQLIKTIVECSNVVQMMEKFNLYSTDGLRRFLELRDNLTTQFQLQERNNMILNSWIITYALCEPFVRQVKNLEEFVDNLSRLSNIDETSLEHIKNVNDNIQIVTMWLSAEETTILDNALITMEHIYITGMVNIRLRRLMNEQSYFEIEYSIDKVPLQSISRNNSDSDEHLEDEIPQVKEKIKFTLSMADIEDHKRQLTFCNVDLQQNMFYRKIVLNEQLKLLQIIEKIYSILLKLEMAGHPNFQLKENNYEIYDRSGEINRILADLKNNPDNHEEQLAQVIQERTSDFEAIYRGFQTDYERWIKDLEKYRHEHRLLKLFSNRQVMIMIILLTIPSTQNQIQRQFLEKLSSSKDNLTILCLIHYLQSLRINDCNLSTHNITALYNKYKIEYNSPTDLSLKQLCLFLKDLFNNGNDLFKKNSTINENQQFLVTINSVERTSDKIEIKNDFDMDTCCILLNIFNDRLPADYQILWGSISTEDDIRLFFSRVRTFRYLTFAVMDIDKMHHRLRQLLFNEQDSLAKQSEHHAPIYYFSRELTLCRKCLRPFYITPRYRNPKQTYSQLIELLRRNNLPLSQIEIIYGAAGIGKTHRIKTKYIDHNTSCVSINDKINLSSLISSFLSFESKSLNNQHSIYFNISIHAPFEQLNRLFFSLFICGSLNDVHSGLRFSPSITKQWKFIIEVPYTDKSNITIQENFNRILPLLSIISPSTLEEVTDISYQLFIGKEEELVARFLKAYENRTINRFMIIDDDDKEKPVDFDPLTDHNECRQYIYNCIEKYAPQLPRNKIFELSFTKFLYRRARFFTGFHYRFNTRYKHLGSTAMKQMINEATCLTQMDFSSNDYPRVYLVYDPEFSLNILHNNWNDVPRTLKALFSNRDQSKETAFEKKNYYVKCLSWLLDIPYDAFEKQMKEIKFILTENFAYKLFHIHERKLTKLTLIIEGETGVGKTFLLNFYSLLLNSNIIHGELHGNIAPRIRERTSLWLLKMVINNILKNEMNLLSLIQRRIESKLYGSEYNDDDEENQQNRFEREDEHNNREILLEIKQSLQVFEYDNDVLRCIWEAIITISDKNANDVAKKLIVALHDFVTLQLIDLPLIEASFQLKQLLEEPDLPTVKIAIEIFNEFLVYTRTKPLFYRLLLHPGVTEEQIEHFMAPISQLAEQIPRIEFVVFFDEVNTSSCLGLFKEMFMDRTLHGMRLPENIFFTAAINPLINRNDDLQVHRRDYLVHELPQSLENLKVSYGILDENTLKDYIQQKIATFTVTSTSRRTQTPLGCYAQNILTKSILEAQQFCETYLGRNSVSQREIQRCFNLIDFFWNLKYDENDDEPDPIRCITLSLALIYYFRLPTNEDNSQRSDHNTPSREKLGEILSRYIPDFVEIIQNELKRFVNTKNFVIPQGVAVNQAIREHIFAIVVSIATRTPLCIIGAPGQSKTLSFQIVLQNLQGSQLSTKSFCKSLPAIDPFFCLGSKYSRSEDIAYIFERAIKREQQYQQNRIDTRCVVFLDEASLPDEKKMVLKVLHPYLDECRVAFVAVANKSFDAANANRMICIYRSLPSKDDQKILAYGCLGLPISDEQSDVNKQLDHIISGLCQGYRRVLTSPIIPRIFHDRDFIYMLRELRFELSSSVDDQETSINSIKPISLLRALEDNFNGIKQNEFGELVNTFFESVEKESPNFSLTTERRQAQLYRDVPTILRESMKLDSKRRRLYGRYKLIIDESEDESAINLLSQTGILNFDPNQTTVFRMSDFSDDINNELRNVEILSTIKLCMETGKTILMVNTSRIHGSLYDVFNQNFSIMATGETRKIFSKVAIGPKTIDVVVHEDFQCIIHIKRSELKDTPAPFLSRFQKYSLSVNDFYRIRAQKLPRKEQIILSNIEEKAQTFIQHFGRQYFYGLNESTLYSCLLPLIKINDNGEHSLLNIYQSYTQLTMKLKSFIEQNPADIQQCLLRFVLSKLIQLVSPESIILKLPTFETTVGQWLCNLYFQQQEHFNIENFIQQLLSNPLINVASDDTEQQMILDTIHITTKAVIFTRTSSYVVSLSQQSKNELFSNNDENYDHNREKIDILNLGTIENSVELQDRFNQYENDHNKSVFIIVIDGRIGQQRLHIPFVRQLIDKTEYTCNTNNQTERKYFIMLVHSPAQDLYHQSCFPSIFLHDWDFYFFDTCASGSAFHLQKMLRILSSSSSHDLDNVLCDLNILFEDCLWNFCSRIQIILPELPQDMFTNKAAYEFYQRQTNTIHRVECIKQILRGANQLQKHIVNIYHEHLLSKKNSSEKIYKLIYEISKDILCGKRFDGLIDSIQSQTRNSFTNFVSNIFKFIVNDYGLETLTKLSTDHQNYGSLLNLIDYQSFAVNDDQDIFSSTTTQGIFQLVTHYSCIPQTPLYHLLHQRIKAHADQIKLTLIRRQIEDNDDQHHATPPVTTADNNYENEDEMTQYTFDQFRYKLIDSMMNDKVLTDIICERILHSYSDDLVRTFCTIAENNFQNDRIQCQQTIEFVSRWLLLIDENDRQSLDSFDNKNLWHLAHVYTLFEYEQNDLISMYSASRIINCLHSTRESDNNLFNNENITRSNVRERFFRSIFDYLWKNLSQLCLNNENNKTWIYTYTFISKYYPSEKVLKGTELIKIKNKIEFMNLAYLIFFNNKTSEPQELVSILLQETDFNQSSICLKLLPNLTDIICRYSISKNIDNLTLMIDLQQWIITILKSTGQTSKQDVHSLFEYLDKSTFQLSLSMKQYLFDELINLSLKFKQRNKRTFDIWDRFDLIPTILNCTSNLEYLENYQIPYHPSILSDVDDLETRPVLLDLYFFHLQYQMINETISWKLVNKGMLLKLAKIEDRRLKSSAENLFQQLKNHFRLKMIGLLLCQTNSDERDFNIINSILSTIITELLLIDQQPTELNLNLQFFLSTIISKQSWTYLLNLLKSKIIQDANNQWATNLYDLLKLKHRPKQNKYLYLCHQIQFTLSSDDHSSIFPKLHQPYEELREIIDTCVQNNTEENQWNNLSDWIGLKLNSDPIELELNEIKVMLLLIIYYDYYCNNQLSLIDSLLELIEDSLQLSSEELRVFRVFIRPKEYLIGYSIDNNNIDKNFLNNLFQLDCEGEFELSLRHMLVNLLTMIILGGKQSFLWTFVFQPSTLQNTFGFGSTSKNLIQSQGVHYDCGCIISQNGDLIQFTNRGNACLLNVPAVYVAYFSTFGALAWHLLLFNTSVGNLNGPILASSAITTNEPAYQLAGNSIRAKVCQFVCTRLLSTYHFLSIQSNQNDACILLSRCFERMAFLTQQKNTWIKTIYRTIDEKRQAEQEYKDEVFYFVYNNLVEYKAFVNQLNLQSEIQMNLQNFIDQMPLVIQFIHFKTESYRLTNSESSPQILQYILNSFDFLKITKLIYDLSQFYLLLHQTYTQLIERGEFLTINLKELYDRGQKYYNRSHYQQYQNENKTHRSIIENGIAAVNSYHEFADGLIRPGACDETQRFASISFDSPVQYLVTNENPDEGDIIMRILSVLVDYQNSLLDLLEKESSNNPNHTGDALKNLIIELSSKTVSILQVANDNTGVITLDEKDCLWIEQLSRASLNKNDKQYFLTSTSRLTFDFDYVQSQIIQTYFLLCHINYRHIIQKYRCHTKRMQTTTTNVENLDLDEKYLISLSDDQVENEWNYLKNMLLDKLYNAHSLIRQIALTLKNHPDDLSSTFLFDFVRKTDDGNNLYLKLEQYEIKDFHLCHIDHVLKLYTESMSSFQYLFTDVSPLLRMPIATQLNDELIQNFKKNLIDIDYNNDTDKIQSIIQTITELLDELKTIEDTLLQQSTQSLTEICEHLTMKNPVLLWIPKGIKCENYVTLSIHLIRTRSILQEQKVNIEEKEMKLWEENFNPNEQLNKQANLFVQYLNPPNKENNNESSNWAFSTIDTDDSIIEFEEQMTFEDHIEYSSLMELNIKLVPCSSSIFTQQIHKYRQESQVESMIETKLLKITITHPNGESASSFWKRENFSDKLKKLFNDKNYDSNTNVVVDKNEIFVDFTNNNYYLPLRPLLEYRIAERQSLFPVQFQFRTQQFEYFITSKAKISAVIHRFIDDNHLQSLSPNTILCFFNKYGQCIDDEIITDLHKTIFVTEETSDANILCEITVEYNEDPLPTNLFHPTTKWQQIDLWLKTLPQKIDPSIDNYAFLLKEQKTIIDVDQTISSIFDQTESVTIDIINRNIITKVIFSYETNHQPIYALKSMKISSLFNKKNLFQQLNLIDISSDDCVLVLGEINEQILTKDDLQQPISTYSTNDNQCIHFRIFISVQIMKYDNQEQIKIPLSSRNTTIEQLLQLTGQSIDVYKYLASNDTKRILNPNETIANLNKTKFILVKENETCLVSISKSRNLQNVDINNDQRFVVCATIADVNKENQIDILHRNLLYSNDFVPSLDTQLISLQLKSLIQFTVIDGNLPAIVTVQNSEENKSVRFNCSGSMRIKRLSAISCQLFGANHEYYCLMQGDTKLDDDDVSLKDIGENETEFQFQMISIAPIHCSITFHQRKVILPCRRDTLVSTIVRESLEKLHIPLDDINMYELMALTDDDPAEIDFDLSMEDIQSMFSSDSSIITLELKNK